MNICDFHIDSLTAQKLLSAGSGDVALLYLYTQAGNPLENAPADLRLSDSRFQCAAATLRQLGLWEDKKSSFLEGGEPPRYSEQDVVDSMNRDSDFRSLYQEIQSLLGRTLNVEELKIVLGFVRYLGLPADVICVLICYCKDQQRQRGRLRNPSLRSIEKEAYAWAERGIDTMEAAAAFIQAKNVTRSQMESLKQILQIRGRELTPGEERYAQKWIEMAFAADALELAYERTCLNTGGMNWPYMNKILESWHQAGLHNAQQVRAGDPKKGAKRGPRQLDADELAAIAQSLREG